LRGARFESHSIPVEVLPELAAFQELVVEVAKELYRRRHPNRKRVSSGFVEHFQLRLQQIEGGSAVCRLERVLPPSSPLFRPVEQPDEFDEAQELIGELIIEMAGGRSVPRRFPRHLLPAFNNFGKRLREDESIELHRPDQPVVPLYTLEVRKRIVLLASHSYQAETEVTGIIDSADVLSRRFRLRLEEGRGVWATYPPAMEQSVLGALQRHTRTRVHVVGIGNFNREDLIESFEEVFHVTAYDLIDEQSVRSIEKRIKELQVLEAGWCDGEGEALPVAGLRWLQQVLVELIGAGLPMPYLYPTPVGGVQAEWSLGPWEISAEIDLGTRSAYLHATHMKEEEVRDVRCDLTTEAGEDKLLDFVLEFMPAEEFV
jgi:hypothetical protein